MTFKAANCEDVVRNVIQAGKPEFVTIQSAKSVSKDGVPTLTIEGTTNSSKLTFSLASGGSLPLTLPATYLANSLTTNNGAAITGDPGATQEFPFSIQFTDIAKNPVSRLLVIPCSKLLPQAYNSTGMLQRLRPPLRSPLHRTPTGRWNKIKVNSE